MVKNHVCKPMASVAVELHISDQASTNWRGPCRGSDQWGPSTGGSARRPCSHRSCEGRSTGTWDARGEAELLVSQGDFTQFRHILHGLGYWILSWREVAVFTRKYGKFTIGESALLYFEESSLFGARDLTLCGDIYLWSMHWSVTY